MMKEIPVPSTIEEALKKKIDLGIQSIQYFHCDHFEPWRHGVRQQEADEVAKFIEKVGQLWYAQKLSLFYKPQISYVPFEGEAPDDVLAIPNEPFGFRQQTEDQKKIAASCIQEAVKQGHDFQVHVHHEGYTRSSVDHAPKIRSWLTKHGTEKADELRLDMSLKLHLSRIRAETGLPFKTWMFVHGNWALNGSDHRICQIRDEIRILMENGCVGDFTFPAGRRHVDPTILQTPYTCKPFLDDKGYDKPGAEPYLVTDPRSRLPGRFFIWNSIIKHPFSSIDYVSKTVQKSFLDPSDVVVRWLEGSPVFDQKLYIKTHCHSMNRYYWEDLEKPIVPHEWPAIQRAFGTLREACEKLNIPFEMTTARGAFDALTTGRLPPPPVNLNNEDQQVNALDLQKSELLKPNKPTVTPHKNNRAMPQNDLPEQDQMLDIPTNSLLGKLFRKNKKPRH